MADVEMHYAVSCVAKVMLVESIIQGEKSWTVKLQEEWDNLVVIHAASALIESNLPDRDAPTLEELTLTFRKMLVQQYHTGTDSIT